MKIAFGLLVLALTFIAAHIMLNHGYGFGVLLVCAGVCYLIATIIEDKSNV